MPAVRSIEVAERRARIGFRHRLADQHRVDDVAEIADAVVALHSSDPVAVYLSATARMRNPSLAAMDTALYDDRTLVRHHAMRRTLWVLAPHTARLAHASTTVTRLRQQRRVLVDLLEQTAEITDPEAWIAQASADTIEMLRRRGPTSARQLGREVPALASKLRLAPGKSYGADVAAHTRVLLLLGCEGAIVRTRPTGSWINGEYQWAVTDDWLDGGLVGADPLDAAAGLTHRWLRSFGPAPLTDLQWWAGWSGAATRAALARAGAQEVDLDGTQGWLAADDHDPVPGTGPWVALLPGLDPTTMGWKQRDWYLDPALAGAVFDRNGNGGPAVWADGRIVGGWVQRPTGEIAVRLLVDVGSEQRLAIDAAASRLQDLLGDCRFKVRFPAPMQADLLA